MQGDPARAKASAAEVREVSVRELDRNSSAVLAEVRDGQRTIVTRYGIPVAVLLSVADALELGGPRPPRPIASVLQLRVELREELATLLGSEAERRVRRRELGRYLHGRWYERR